MKSDHDLLSLLHQKEVETQNCLAAHFFMSEGSLFDQSPVTFIYVNLLFNVPLCRPNDNSLAVIYVLLCFIYYASVLLVFVSVKTDEEKCSLSPV